MYRTGIAIVWMVALAAGCHSHEKSSQGAPSPPHADEPSRLTLFSENMEFFIEHEALEAGKESQFLVYVTHLSTYKPVETGSLSIRVDGVSVNLGEPQHPGIFEVPFLPKKAGAFHAVFSFKSIELAESVEGHVHVYKDHEDLHAADETPSAHSHEKEEAGEISFLKEQAWNSDFRVTRLEPQSFSSIISTSGEILAMPGEKKNVAANGKGMVLFTSPNLVQGSPVQKGQQLFTISSETMLEENFELTYQEWQNNYEKTKSEYLRHQKLFARGAISEREFIDTRSEFLADSLRYYNLKANANTEGLKVISPVTGTIHELNVSEGQFIDVGQIMVIISSNKTLLIRADLGQQHYPRLEEIASANFRPAYSDQVFGLEEVNGRLLAAGSSVAENDHYLPIMFEVRNDGSILEGAYTEVYLKTAPRENCLVLPLTALSEEQGGYHVYVQVSGESYSKKAVQTGDNDGRLVEITGGLQPGERVVTRGSMLLKAASTVSAAIGHGHSH